MGFYVWPRDESSILYFNFTYGNTTLLRKRTKKSPVMLGPIFIFHEKDERYVKLLYHTLLDHCSGLGPNLRVLGADGENSILNQACHTFPFVILLLCIFHLEENIKRNFPNKIPDSKKNEVMKVIFGNDIEKGLVDCESLEEFEQNLSQFYEYR